MSVLTAPVKYLTALGIAALLCACATPGGGGGGGASVVASDVTTSNVARVGFLSDYAKLAPVAGGGGMLCWREPSVDWKRYDKVLFERIQVHVKPDGAQKTVDPADLKTLFDYFHSALVNAIKGQAQVVNTTGPTVLRVRIAITNLVPTNSVESLAGTAVPYGFVAEIGSGAATGRPAGSTPYLGQTGMEAQFRDGASGKVVAECADTEIGRKYAADLNQGAPNAAATWVNGYLDSFSQWSYAKDAFDKWAAVFAQRFSELRTMRPNA